MIYDQLTAPTLSLISSDPCLGLLRFKCAHVPLGTCQNADSDSLALGVGPETLHSQ